ncbi:MAG: FKBP-type peptidyl-prolyl cis-trans isomerase [Candidatus Lokiarchaeota archaeon]|nr:FKBP-type peptidyl-prolyl cis-trans isomerase [Candidatus Lokiarchaeota archaeon]
MPKTNPKKSSRYSQYYRRAKERAITEKVKDRAPLYYGLTFVGVVVAIVIVVLALTLPEILKLKSQRGDTVTVQYIGSYAINGTVFDPQPGNPTPSQLTHKIGDPGLLDYFDQQLVGMEPGVKKVFVIPAQFGYTDPSNKLYGYDLRFEVTIVKLVRGGETLYPKAT